VDFVVRNSNKLQKLGLEGKISWALNVFTLLNLEIFNFENVKNKECVHTWANLGQALLLIMKNQWTFLKQSQTCAKL
jgi:hypothetical protein